MFGFIHCDCECASMWCVNESIDSDGRRRERGNEMARFGDNVMWSGVTDSNRPNKRNMIMNSAIWRGTYDIIRSYKAKATAVAKAATKPSDAVVAAAPAVVPVDVPVDELVGEEPTQFAVGVAPACGQWVLLSVAVPSNATPTWYNRQNKVAPVASPKAPVVANPAHAVLHAARLAYN
jgi:hypothetical protein